MMAQWHACKVEAKDALVLFRLGDFYEAFYEDAHTLSKELDLTLTKRQDIPMSGIPHHTSEGYIDKMLAKGYKIAIVEQTENPKDVKGLVKREIVRIVTPGTVVNSHLLSENSNNYILCLSKINASFGIAFLDLTTADFRVQQLENEQDLLDELVRLRPKEIIVSEKCHKNHKNFLEKLPEYFPCLCTIREEWHFEHRSALQTLQKHFKVHCLDGFGMQEMTTAINSAGALLLYVHDELYFPVNHITKINIENSAEYMSLDQSTQRHLEITEPLNQRQAHATLLHLLDKSSTPMGARLLRKWLTHPLLCAKKINMRLDAVEVFMQSDSMRKNLSLRTAQVRDLERLIMKIVTSFAGPRDFLSLCISLEQIPELISILENTPCRLLSDHRAKLHDLSKLTKEMRRALLETCPLHLGDSRTFKEGYYTALDELYELQANSHKWIASYQNTLREQTNIKTLKVGFTKAFGYYIEVSRGQAEKMPPNFQRRQTLVNAERFISPELKEHEYKVLTAEEKISYLEKELFESLRKNITNLQKEIQETAESVANIDCLLSLSQVALTYNYTRPLVDETDTFTIKEGRHPVVEAFAQKETFIPNDVYFDEAQKLHLITGPNMAGKSTYLRQVALIAIMAQIGSMVPASKAHIGIIDKVCSRIGASDDLSRGKSTFMVEMTETATILHTISSKSLVILDEIGRGTSTYDGISIAWAVAEFLLTTANKKAKTLFATHYWELTELEEKIPGSVNYNVAVHESEEGITFLHKIVRGGTDKSYGIHVARLAGLPASVIKSAQEMLAKIETGAKNPVFEKGKLPKTKQLNLFTNSSEDKKTQALSEQVLTELAKIDPNHLTPLEAFSKIVQWKKTISPS